MTEEKRHMLHWHPAFYAEIQLELQDDAVHLEFLQEHTLGTEPVRIDLVIIKKTDGKPIRKNIGQIFRKYNIVEYKSPGDYLSIDDFYKAYGYCNFYKALNGSADSVKITDITLTLVCSHHPARLISHLKEVRGYKLRAAFPGIYEVIGDVIPIQIILTQELSEKENLWLKNLTNNLNDKDSISRLLADYSLHKKDAHYRTVMEIIVRANMNKFREVHSEMCDALMELMKDELAEQLEEGRRSGLAEGWQSGLAEGRQSGLAEGRQSGLAEGRQSGLAEGIRALVSTCHNLGVSKETAVTQLMNGFSMNRETALENVQKYW